MIELIAKIVLIGSFLGMLVILIRKIPTLALLPEVKTGDGKIRERLWGRIKTRAKDFSVFRFFSSDIFWQKILSKIRVLTLKFENKVGNHLQELREKTQKKNLRINYWRELKKPADRKENKNQPS